MLGPFLYLAVIVGGAAILALEILGTRIIGPFYGVSLYLWSALIGVTLAALAVGYAVGGRLADRGPRLDRFCALLGLAGLWTVLIPWLRHPVLAATESAGLRLAVLLTATILFFPPLMLLGMVSPYAIRLKARRLDEVGRTAGNLFAVSTVASVAAALGTGFYLIPHLGVGWLTFAAGLLLIATALTGFALQRRLGASAAAGLVLLLAVAGAIGAAPSLRADPERGLLEVAHSPYGEIRVLERGGLRYLLIDGTMHSAIDPATGASPFAYVDVIDLADDLFERPGRMLLVGLGAGSLARSFSDERWQVDAVEIDPTVVRVAREHFGFNSGYARVVPGDGRRYLRETDRRYDLVVLDAFGSSSIPFHLVTREAFALIHDRLAPGGVVVLNLWAVGWHDVIVGAVAATLQTSFAHVLALPLAEPPDQLDNLIVMASDRPLELRWEPPGPSSRFGGEYHRAHAWDNRFVPETTGAPVITDDRNPVDVWSERINLVARRQLHRVFGEDSLAW